MSEPIVCRCCLSTDGALRSLTSECDWTDAREVYRNMLLQTLNIELTDVERLVAGGICDACISRLIDATTFRSQVLVSEQEFLKLYGEIKSEIVLDIKELCEISDGEKAYESPTYDSDYDSKDEIKLSYFAKTVDSRKRKSADSASSSKRSRHQVSQVNTSVTTDPDGDSDRDIWTSTDQLQTLTMSRSQEFRAAVGPEPSDYFTFFVDDGILLLACNETNQYAKNFLGQRWKEVTLEEFKIFLGLLIHMGTVRLNRIQDYWKCNRLIDIHIFKDNMSENRFLQILKTLKFGSDKDDPLGNIREVVLYFNEKMDGCYYPDKDMTVEALGLKNGRLSRANLKHKCPKIYSLKEKDSVTVRIGVNSRNCLKKGKLEIVANLMMGKFNNGHSLYLDSHFCSCYLAKTLLDLNTYCTGILKNVSAGAATQSLCKGEIRSRLDDGVHVGKWRSKKLVNFISTEFKDFKTFINTNGQKSTKPEAVIKHEDFTAERNKTDYTFTFYPCANTSMRWYKKLFIHIVHLLLVNAHKFYNKYSGSRVLTYEEFRMSVVDSLLPQKTAVCSERKSKRVRAVSTQQVKRVESYVCMLGPSTSHVIRKIEERNSSGRIKRKMCRQCSKSGKRADSIYHCIYCYEQPGLCLACFDVFHSAQSS